MSVITFTNPSPTLKGASSSMALHHTPPASASLGFGGLLRAGRIPLPRLVGVSMRQRTVRKLTVFSFAAPHEESKPSDVGIEREKQAQESEEAWKQSLASFKEQALKMVDMSKQAYELYSEKALWILIETCDKLKIPAEKARKDLIEIAKDVSTYELIEERNYEFGCESTVFKVTAEIAPVKLRDYHVGIPYGALLCGGGFISYMLSGSIPAVRFGILLGGTLLALSISSLKLWKKGEPTSLLLKGQAAIATVLFLRELRFLWTQPLVAILTSGGVFAFYVDKIIREREQPGGAEA